MILLISSPFMNRIPAVAIVYIAWLGVNLCASGGVLPSQEMHAFHEKAKIIKLPVGSKKIDTEPTGIIVDCSRSIGQIERRDTVAYLRLTNFKSWNSDLADLFQKLPNLRYFIVEGDAAALGPEWAVLQSIPSLRYLWIKLRRLESIPPWFGQLKQVTGIDLSNNRLREVPTDLLSLEQLQELDISENEIRILAHSFAGMTSLERLNLSHNSIMWISEKIIAPPSLRELALDSNKLEVFPAQFTSVGKLERLEIGNNYFDNIPAAWLSKSGIKRLTISRFVQHTEEIKKMRPDLKLILVEPLEP
jgi:hypothetical protein